MWLGSYTIFHGKPFPKDSMNLFYTSTCSVIAKEGLEDFWLDDLYFVCFNPSLSQDCTFPCIDLL